MEGGGNTSDIFSTKLAFIERKSTTETWAHSLKFNVFVLSTNMPGM
jgi:hypothetical protein